MAKTKQQKKQQPSRKGQSVVVRAPTSQSARRTTQNSGDTQTILLAETKRNSPADGPTIVTIHPGALPWLQGVAPSFQRWKLNNVKIWYEPRVSTSTNGTIALAFQRDFQDGTPRTRSSLILSEGSTRSAIWDKPRPLQVPPGPAREYCSLSSFNALSPTDKNERALGRLFIWQDSDADMVGGYVYMSYTPSLTGPVDPTTQ